MKHLYKVTIKLFFLLFFVSGVSFAQTTNSGTLYVSADTEFSVVNDFQNTDEGEYYNDGEAFIYADFDNNGLINYYGETGITRFRGVAVQELSGAEESYLYDAEFNNDSDAAPFHLSGAITIDGEANFLTGIVDNDNHGGSIYFGEDASHSSTSDASHVDGYVGHYGANDFVYPIGDGGFYRYAGTADLTNTSTIVEAKYFLENSDALYSHDLKSDLLEIINTNEYWTIENLVDSEEAFITLSWDEATTPEEILEEPRQSAIRIVRWDEAENRWVDEGGIVDNTNRTVSTAVDEYGVFTLARVKEDDVLPCQINVHNAVTPNGDGVNDYFKINTGSSSSCTENLQVEIYNRWGIKVFETNNYGETGDIFDGFSRGRLNVSGDKQLPSGTYFYILKFDYETGNEGTNVFKKTGYLYLNGN